MKTKHGMTTNEIQQRLEDTRDPHAHARIDAMQVVLAQMLSDLAINGVARDINAALLCFKQGDDLVDEAFGLHVAAGTGRSGE